MNLTKAQREALEYDREILYRPIVGKAWAVIGSGEVVKINANTFNALSIKGFLARVGEHEDGFVQRWAITNAGRAALAKARGEAA